MSLFDSASLVITPNGTKASKLYSIIPTDGSGDLTVTRATTSTRVNSSGLVATVSNNVPRLDYLNSSCPTILVESQRTNNFAYSEQFDNAYWTKISATVTANNTTAPDGTATADKVEFNGGYVSAAAVVTDNLTYTVSFFAKKGTANLFQISEAFYFGTSVVFDLNAGTVTSGTGKIENYGNGWYRCSTQVTYGVGQVVSAWLFRNYQSGYVYVWGAQLEAGSYPTSYIPTTTAAVTRNADVISKTSVSSLIGQTEGTIFAEIKVSKLLGTASRYIFHISDGTTNNRIYMAFSGASSNVIRARIFNGGTLQCSINTSAITTTGTYRLAMAYKSNDIVFYVNGTQIGTDTSATIPTCSRVDLGHNSAGASQLNDGITNANIWKTRLTNDELASLTSL